MHERKDNSMETTKRREFICQTLSIATLATTVVVPSAANAVERAVGGAEISCREEGNCLQKFEIDGAVGWNWGGKDRCDATDPRCGPDGSLRDAPPSGKAVPDPISDEGIPLKITDTIQIEIAVGRKEIGTLNIGLYGEVCPSSTKQMMDFFSENIYSGGLLSTSKLMLEDGLGVQTAPVSFIKGGNLQLIYPQNRLDFGIASQSVAYAKMKRLTKVDNFVAQPRPNKETIIGEKSARAHKYPGLLSIPKAGLGYGGSGLESDDEAFTSSFQITANNVPSMDRDRKVIGQIIDTESMDFLERLASLPTQKGLKGVIPGQNSGPPLIKVSVTAVSSSSNDTMGEKS
eukprot:CAMPEP_0203671252 /NCGR_PEP_ID=MMETSP0090-20130426/7092_1 /ASSEMBLY_ACC=CAM_ASM_001088 /TAXON_ID=426623 /ORGANISM="Chaetoceros affinis, Strain CCMP159" /LENGTH=344 /DNA_ID=CAMNT_0050536279 /DNA_START=37 /DNA_END=1071 /DNA_ORIENTATION=-